MAGIRRAIRFFVVIVIGPSLKVDVLTKAASKVSRKGKRLVDPFHRELYPERFVA